MWSKRDFHLFYFLLMSNFGANIAYLFDNSKYLMLKNAKIVKFLTKYLVKSHFFIIFAPEFRII